MSRVKLLFAPENIGFAEKIANALADQGYEAANDDGPASAALVIWSPGAASSPAILSAARAALARRVLVPVALGKAPPPSSFEHLWPMDLSGWTGRNDDPRWRFVLDEVELAVRRGIDAAPDATPAPSSRALPRKPSGKRASESVSAPAPRSRVNEDLFADAPAYQPPEERPGPRLSAAMIMSVLALFGMLGAGAFYIGKNRAPLADETSKAPVVAFVQPKDQPAEDRAVSEALPPIEVLTSSEAPAADLRDPAGHLAAVTDAAASPVAATLDAPAAAATSPPETEAIAALTQEALRAADAAAGAEESAAAAGGAEGDADPIAELAWTATGATPGLYFRDCLDCPDMAEIRPDGARGYALGVRAITNGQWRACVADGACPAVPGGADSAPVTGASYVDARAFIVWLSSKTGAGYRLPSEQEWDVGAEGSTDAAPNSFGLYRMAGGSVEWTNECWVADGVTTAAEDGGCGARVLKGDGRDAAPAGERRHDAGFRVARDLF